MLKILSKLNKILDARQKIQMFWLLIMMLISAVLETASISLVIPVVTVVMDKNAIENTKYISDIYNILAFKNYQSFTVMVMLSLIVAFILKNVFLFFQQKALYKFIYTNQFRTSEQVMKKYMNRSYEFYLNADTAVIQRNITSDVNHMYGLIRCILLLVSEAIVFVFLAAVLLVADPKMTLIIASLLIVTLFVVKVALKPVLKKAGKQNQDNYSGLFKWINQIVTGIKEVKIGNSEAHFIKEYLKCGYGYVEAVQKYMVYSSMPRLLIETVCIIGMITYLLVLVLSGSDVDGMMSIIAAFGLAVVRLMPCASRINNQINDIAYFEPPFMSVADQLKEEIDRECIELDAFTPAKEKLPLEKEIVLKDICYKYPNTDKYIFDNANVTIPVGKSIGIVGTTGSGKSTLVDVLLGLLEIEKGSITVDGAEILKNDNYRKWLKNVGYIPQSIFMLDDTIRKNICFGIPEEEISEERLWQVAEDAQIADFIKTLPDGMETSIGERGIRLSGGQRQRISIARALYHDPELLILDEATSALDNDTETAIMDSINLLHGKKTLVIVAHRLQTIEKCDAVYRVENGKILKER